MSYSKSMLNCLDLTAWGMKHFGSICTNRVLPLAVMRRCIEAGLCECIGMVRMCDGDGFTLETHRERPGYVLTAKGREALDDYHASLEPVESPDAEPERSGE